jgi:hypothetical protein
MRAQVRVACRLGDAAVLFRSNARNLHHRHQPRDPETHDDL